MQIQKKKIVMFDLDGTLTPPRGKMTHDVSDALYRLQQDGFEIGIVTGSDMDYIIDQCEILFDLNPIDFNKLHFLPCNGTKYYKYRATMENIYDNDMRNALGEKHYRRLIQLLINLQSAMTRVHRKIPLSGTFVQYRGSTINWCPIGRAATLEDRRLWEEYNINDKIRAHWLEAARFGLESANLNGVVIKFGGDTSFDIYPTGWDKTYALKQFSVDWPDRSSDQVPLFDTIYFVGDRCTPTGNDYEAYLMAEEKGFITSSPTETIDIIHHIMGLQ